MDWWQIIGTIIAGLALIGGITAWFYKQFNSIKDNDIKGIYQLKDHFNSEIKKLNDSFYSETDCIKKQFTDYKFERSEFVAGITKENELAHEYLHQRIQADSERIENIESSLKKFEEKIDELIKTVTGLKVIIGNNNNQKRVTLKEGAKKNNGK